ncbi:MAG: HEPN domain-containing protein [Planctomycetia bacterium]|nr:HEPN domain-containing protein [Planctomycetia bacterium]
MKTSLENVPTGDARKLQEMTRHLVQLLPSCDKVILFGSYARGDFVVLDHRCDFGVSTTYKSDYDILVVHPSNIYRGKILRILKEVKQAFEKIYTSPLQPTLQFLTLTDKEFSQFVREGRYFYMDVLKEGILLHTSGTPLPQKEWIDTAQFRKMAHEYYQEYFHQGEVFLRTVQFLAENQEYTTASFLLHQATEKFYQTVLLVFTLYKAKHHDIAELREITKSHAPELLAAFPRNTPEENYLFELLCRAYIEARYNSQFVVTQKELERLKNSVKLLQDIVKTVCEKKIEQIVLREETPPQEENLP